MQPDQTPLEFAGDNPCVVLYDEAGRVSAAASYWNTFASSAGVGQVLFLLTRDEGRPFGRIYADNVELVEFCADFNRHFLGFEEFDWSIKPQPAYLEMVRRNGGFALVCSFDDGAVALEWRDLDDAYVNRVVNTDFGNEVGRSYEVSCIIIPAANGSIHFNGTAQPGVVSTAYGGLPRSAFLAFGEIWSRVESGPT